MDSDSESFVPVFASQSKKRKLLFADQEPPDRARQFLTQKPEEWLGPISSFSASAAPSGPQNQQQQSLQLPDHSDDDDFYPISLHQVDLDDEIGQQVVSPFDYTPGNDYSLSSSSDDEEQLQPHARPTQPRAKSLNPQIQTNADGTFQCPFCAHRGNTKSNVNTHVRKHTGERPFECSECEWKFADQSGLKRHMQTHTGEKPFKCQLCKKKFADKSSLTGHTETQHGGYQFMHSIYFNHCF